MIRALCPGLCIPYRFWLTTPTQLLSRFLALNYLARFNHLLSIVAVHGLGANPDYAWVWLPKNNPGDRPEYPNKPYNWLKELLPNKLSCRVRVMTFNYDSKWFMNAPQQRLSNISDTLLHSLQNKRKEVSPMSYLKLRPGIIK